MKTSIESTKTWLMSSGLFISDEKNSDYGAVYSFFDQKTSEYSFLYPEITGYFISLNRYLYKIEKNDIYKKYAKASSDWLIKLYEKYGGIIQGISKDISKQNLVYSFDTAICAKGLLDNYFLSRDDRYLNYAQKFIDSLINEFVNEDGTVKPFKNLQTNSFDEDKKFWYKQSGCLHIKTAIPILCLYKITQNKKLLEIGENICYSYKLFQNDDGSFKLHKNNDVVNLHTLSYALEGLLFAFSITKNPDFLNSCKKAINWCVSNIDDNGGISLWYNFKDQSKAAYPISQIIRIMILLDKLENRNSKDQIEKLMKFLLSLQANNSDTKINGGFYEELYKSIFGWKKRMRLNSWTSMFALQAMDWWNNYEKITFDNSIEYIY